MPRPMVYTDTDKRLLEQLLAIHGRPGTKYGAQIKYFREISKAYNAATSGSKRDPLQIRNYVNNERRKQNSKRRNSEKKIGETSTTEIVTLRQPESTSTDIVCRNVRSLGSPAKQKPSVSSSSGYLGSSSETTDEFRSLSDDLPKSWEYTEIGSSFMTSIEPGSSVRESDDREEPHIFDDIDDLSFGRASTQEKNGMSQDLVNILTEQARQHHRLKMKLQKEKFKRMMEVYKKKMFILDSELEMKRKQHEQKMDNLHQEYKRIQEKFED